MDSLQQIQGEIDNWASAQAANSKETYAVTVDMGRNVGYGFEKTDNGIQQVTRSLNLVRIIIRPDGGGGWYVHTAYPSDSLAK